MKPNKLLSLILLLLALGASNSVQAAWTSADIGAPARAGSAIVNPDGTITLNGGGADIWGPADQCFYYYQAVTGTYWDAVVNVRSLTGDDDWSKCELMVRRPPTAGGAPEAGDIHYSLMATAANRQNRVEPQYRATRGGNSGEVASYNVPPGYPNCWLRIERIGATFTMYQSSNGTTWSFVDSANTANGDKGFADGAWEDPILVGIAVTSHNNNAPNGATAVVADLSVTVHPVVPPTLVGITRDVANCNTYVGSEATFSMTATNNGSPAQSFPMSYQWYKNGSLVAGVTRTGYTWLASAADSGAQVYCVATPAGYPALATTSATGVLTVASSSLVYTQGLKLEVFAGATRPDVQNSNVGPGDTGNGGVAGKLRWATAFEDQGGYGNNTSRRVTGYFIPWITGNYTFYAACDDDTDVFLSTDATPANKVLICQEMAWSAYNNWTNAGDGADLIATAQKCSNTWTNGAGVTPNPAGIPLTAGLLYYIETVIHNGGGGDNGSVTAQLFDEVAIAGPQNGSATKLTTVSNNIALITWAPTSLAFTLQPTNTTVSEGQVAKFYAQASGDSEFAPRYQWLKNGAPIPGGTALTYGPTVTVDNNATFACVATVPGFTAVTSLVARLTVDSAVFEPGFMLNQRWAGQNRAGVENGTYGDPIFANVVPGMAAAINGEAGSEYTRKISGFFIAPATDRYTFYTCSDDQSDVFISTDATPANKYMICLEDSWSGALSWTTVGGGTASQRSSATFVPAGGTTPPYAAGIPLVANQRYYMEVVQNEGGGGDNVAVTYSRINDNPAYTPANNDLPRTVGNVIGFNAPKSTWVRFTLQPTNPPALVSGPNTATFYAFGDTDSKLAVGDIRAPAGNNELSATNQFVFFQWFKNNVAIAGATASRYTTPWVKPSDNGAQFMCQMRSLGYGTPPNTRLWSNSTPATLTVTTDATVPTIVYSGYYQNTAYSLYYATITFSALMDTNTLANPASYTIGGGVTVTGVEINRNDGRRVTLVLSGAPTFPLTVSVAGARSWSGVALATTPVSVVQSPLTPLDLGLDSGDPNYYPDPMYPSKLWVDGARAYTIAAQGSDIWSTADGFNFLYEAKQGNFDVVMRQTAYSLPNRWAKVGLMMRDELTAGSRNWNIVNDPPDVPTLSDGNGANAVECNWRTNSIGLVAPRGTESTGWGSGAGQAPTYPNAWVRLKRVDQVVTAYAGSDGMTWNQLASMDVSTRTDTPAIPNSMYIGICVTAHHNDAYGIPYEQQLYWNYASVDSYSSAYIAPPPRQTLTITRSGADVVVSWTPTGGTLQSTTDFVTWTPVGAANPSAPITPGATPTFYRVATPYNP